MKEMLKKWGLLSLLFLFTIGIVAGCSSQEQVSQEEEAPKVENVEAESSYQEFPIMIKDSADREVPIADEPETIVSIQASSAESAVALGLGEKIVGVSDYDNDPAEALEIQKVGAQDVNAE